MHACMLAMFCWNKQLRYRLDSWAAVGFLMMSSVILWTGKDWQRYVLIDGEDLAFCSRPNTAVPLNATFTQANRCSA